MCRAEIAGGRREGRAQGGRRGRLRCTALHAGRGFFRPGQRRYFCPHAAQGRLFGWAQLPPARRQAPHAARRRRCMLRRSQGLLHAAGGASRGRRLAWYTASLGRWRSWVQVPSSPPALTAYCHSGSMPPFSDACTASGLRPAAVRRTRPAAAGCAAGAALARAQVRLRRAPASAVAAGRKRAAGRAPGRGAGRMACEPFESGRDAPPAGAPPRMPPAKARPAVRSRLEELTAARRRRRCLAVGRRLAAIRRKCTVVRLNRTRRTKACWPRPCTLPTSTPSRTRTWR